MASSSVTSACWFSGSTVSTSRQMLSADEGSLMIRYRSAFCSAAGTLSREIGFGSKLMTGAPSG